MSYLVNLFLPSIGSQHYDLITVVNNVCGQGPDHGAGEGTSNIEKSLAGQPNPSSSNQDLTGRGSSRKRSKQTGQNDTGSTSAEKKHRSTETQAEQQASIEVPVSVVHFRLHTFHVLVYVLPCEPVS